MQQLLEDVVGKPFHDILQETVLEPSGMATSTFEQPLPDDRIAEAATGHSFIGGPIGDKWLIHPELATAGLWTTANDLARFCIEIMLSYCGESNKILSEEMVEEMLSPQVDEDMGLGFPIGGRGQYLFFGHGGGTEGYISEILAFPQKGFGVAVMTNGAAGNSLIIEILNSIFLEYGFFITNMTICVKNKDEIAISGASVTSTSQPVGQEELSGSTDSDGSVTFSDVWMGNYTIQVSKNGYTTNTGTLNTVLMDNTELIVNITGAIQARINKKNDPNAS